MHCILREIDKGRKRGPRLTGSLTLGEEKGIKRSDMTEFRCTQRQKKFDFHQCHIQSLSLVDFLNHNSAVVAHSKVHSRIESWSSYGCTRRLGGENVRQGLKGPSVCLFFLIPRVLSTKLLHALLSIVAMCMATVPRPWCQREVFHLELVVKQVG